MNSYLESAKKEFLNYKQLGFKAMEQIEDEKLFIKPNDDSNSIAIIVQHLSGNMLSRWTNFLNTDGEKKWRNRDSEFEELITNKIDLITAWHKGWNCLFDALNSLSENDLQKIIFIRNQSHTVTEAINRQLTHYAYHIGQIVLLSKIYCKNNWISLSIPKGGSASFNSEKFNNPKK